MALSRHGKLVTLVPAAVVMMLLCAGAVQATLICGDGQKNCGGKCVHPQTDANNCGNCGVKCTAGANAVSKCKAGTCVPECQPGFLNCDGKWDNGCECQPTTDVNNCGVCGAKCKALANASAKCTLGKCVYTCNPGYMNCDGKWDNGCEVAVATDKKNCGGCGVKCLEVANAFVTCQDKKCVYTCKRGYENCDKDWSNGCECYPETDSKNCGRCGIKCSTGRCMKGKCGKGGDDDNKGGKGGKGGDDNKGGKGGKGGDDDDNKGGKGGDCIRCVQG